MEETEVIGTFLAEQLADENQYSLSKGNNISIITPEMYQDGQILFRDNKQRMVENKQVLILAASITTGKSVKQAIESVLYYRWKSLRNHAIFSSVNKVARNGRSIRSSQAVIFHITEHILRKIARSAEKDSGSKLSWTATVILNYKRKSEDKKSLYRIQAAFQYRLFFERFMKTKKTATDGMAAFLSFIIYLEIGIKQFR